MFKMGCSMARKILAIDGKASSSSNNPEGENSNPSSKKSKGKQQSASTGLDSQASGQRNKASGDELNDFSKLEADPRIPLNVRQIFKITKSWKAIARTMSKTGTAMFLNLFEQNQDLFYLFDRFQHLKGKELHESMELREHAATVMSTLDQSINSLSDYDNFVTYLHSIGKLHRKVPGFKRAHFWKIEQPFLRAVKQTLDERCNESIEEIYKIAIKLIIETISDGYGEDEQNSQEPNASNKPPASDDGGSNNPRRGDEGQRGDRGDTFGAQDKTNSSSPDDKHNNSAAVGGTENSRKIERECWQLESDSRGEVGFSFNELNRKRGENLYASLKAIAIVLAKEGGDGGGRRTIWPDNNKASQLFDGEPLKEALFVLRELLKSAMSSFKSRE